MKITILGIGNLLLKDEGAGIHVIEALKKEQLPENVELIDGAASGFDLLPVVQGCDKLIVIDALKTDDAPGAVYRFNPQDVDFKRDNNFSLHDIDFFQVLDISRKYKKLPQTIIIGIVPEEIGLGMELSDTLKKALPKLTSLVLEEIEVKNITAYTKNSYRKGGIC